MPSTLVHVAIAGIVGAALLGAAFDRRTVAVVLLAGAVSDLDSFASLLVPGTHRALLHTLLLPLFVGGVLWYDTRVRATSRLRERYGARGVRVAWVALLGMVFGGVLPDMFTNGVNAFYPVHDAFYTVDGKALLSNQRGFVQTFVELRPETADPRPTTETLYYTTGVDPSPRPTTAEQNVERVFPLVSSGTQLLVVALSAVLVGVRLWESER